jgi:hypothetical protein
MELEQCTGVCLEMNVCESRDQRDGGKGGRNTVEDKFHPRYLIFSVRLRRLNEGQNANRFCGLDLITR